MVGTIECSNNQSMYQRVDHTTVYSYLLGEVGALYINFLDTVVLPVGGVHFVCLIAITIEVFWVNSYPLPPWVYSFDPTIVQKKKRQKMQSKALGKMENNFCAFLFLRACFIM